jgi:hypothetical protein
MRFEFLCALILSVIAISVANDGNNKVAPDASESSRLFVYNGSFSFTTFTVLKASTTTTSTLTSTTTCTTSSATLTTCTIGRRRRGLFYDEAAAQGRDRRGLFYNDEEVASQDGSAFLPAVARRFVSIILYRIFCG